MLHAGRLDEEMGVDDAQDDATGINDECGSRRTLSKAEKVN
jgi:hypothetical protein